MSEGPDQSAVGVALWRAGHLFLDDSPHVLEDDIGLRLIEPSEGWLDSPAMSPMFRPWRASVLARARFVEDTVSEALSEGVTQFVLLGAGLDSMAIRRPDLMAHVHVFEVDSPATQLWKRRRFSEIGIDNPASLHFVPVDFEAGISWIDAIVEAGFDFRLPAVVASTGVTQYLTVQATSENMRLAARLPTGSLYVCTFILSVSELDEDDRKLVEFTASAGTEHGTPWLSFFAPDEFIALAVEAGFDQVELVSSTKLAERYFAGRSDGLRPSGGEYLIVASRH
jgi:methyltransferase (TIGR00027 family)